MWRILLAACALVGGACFCVVNARAGCDATGAVCESYDSTGNCAAGDGSSFGRTEADVGPVVVAGTSDCSYMSGYGQRSNAITADALGAGVTWASFSYDDVENGHFDGCFVTAYAVTGIYESCPAAASPPDPGWGRLLP